MIAKSSGSHPTCHVSGEKRYHIKMLVSFGGAFNLSVSWWSIVLRTAIIYIAVLLGFRLSGKREMGQMTPFDLVIILLVANAVQNAMVGTDSSVPGGLIAAAVLFAVNYGLAGARERIPWLRHAVEGSPTLLIENGKFIGPHMRREGLEEDEVLMAMREHGAGDVNEVQSAILETDGSISIVPKDSKVIRTRRHARFVKKG
jgi:uncharacterized membrane protein YcaP (DUF421 family)